MHLFRSALAALAACAALVVASAAAAITINQGPSVTLAPGGLTPNGLMYGVTANQPGSTPACQAGQTILWSSPTNPPACGTPTYSTWFPAYTSGNYYWPPFVSGGAGGSALATGKLYCQAFAIVQSVTVKQLFARVTTVGAAGAQVALAVFTNSAGRPSSLLGYTSTPLPATATGVFAEPTNAAFTMTPGVYWTCAETSDGTVAMMIPTNTLEGGTTAYIGSATLANINLNSGSTNMEISGNSAGFNNWSLSGVTWTEGTTVHTPAVGFQVN